MPQFLFDGFLVIGTMRTRSGRRFFSDSDRCVYLWRSLQFGRRVLVRNSEGDHFSILCVCILSIFLACLSADVKSLLLQFLVGFGKQCRFEYTIDVSLFQSVFGVDWSIIQSSQLVIWCYPLLFSRTLQSGAYILMFVVYYSLQSDNDTLASLDENWEESNGNQTCLSTQWGESNENQFRQPSNKQILHEGFIA
jgi:hypothetical protein